MDAKQTNAAAQAPMRLLLALLFLAMTVVFLALHSRPTEVDASVAGAALPARPAAGYPAPDFALTTLDGETLRLSDLRGQPVLLNFWASWCGPCRVEMPHLQAASVTHDGQIAVVGINLTDREARQEDVAAFVDEFGLTFPIALDERGDVADLYEVRGQPASVFIDRDGMVHTVFYGPITEEFIQERIDELVGA